MNEFYRQWFGIWVSFVLVIGFGATGGPQRAPRGATQGLPQEFSILLQASGTARVVEDGRPTTQDWEERGPMFRLGDQWYWIVPSQYGVVALPMDRFGPALVLRGGPHYHESRPGL